MPSFAGVVLAGGRSSRMGTAKAALEWHGSTLLYRTAGIVARAAGGPVLVVRAPGQVLPALPAGMATIEDPREGLGPLQGLAAGLAELNGAADYAFVCSTDMPFLHPAFIRRMLRAAAGLDGPSGGGSAAVDVGLPLARGYPQPLAAAYRTSLAPVAARLVAERRLRPAFLFDECSVARLDDAALLTDPALAALDPDLDSVVNINTPEEYRSARDRPAPAVTVQWLGTLADRDHRRVQVRAATVERAATAAGIEFGSHIAATVNSGQRTTDGQMPLASGDVVCFQAAASSS